MLERFVTLLYGVFEEEITTVDVAFQHKWSDFEHMLPSSDALHQLFFGEAYQSGNLWGNTLNKSPDPVPPTNWGWQKEIYLSLLCAILRETVRFLASAVCMGKPVWFFVNVKVCAPIMVIGMGNRQVEIDLKKDYQDFFQNDKNFNSMYYHTSIQEMSSLISNKLETMYHNSFYNKT